MSVCSRGGRPLGELTAGLIDGYDGVCPLVRIDSDDDHVAVSLLLGVDMDRSADTPELGRCHAPDLFRCAQHPGRAGRRVRGR
jgi:hypothetical protein